MYKVELNLNNQQNIESVALLVIKDGKKQVVKLDKDNKTIDNVEDIVDSRIRNSFMRYGILNTYPPYGEESSLEEVDKNSMLD